MNGGVLIVLPFKETPWALVPSLRKVGQATCEYEWFTSVLPYSDIWERKTYTHIWTYIWDRAYCIWLTKWHKVKRTMNIVWLEPGKRGTFGGETRVFWPIPQHALLQRHSANLHDSASERGIDGSDRVPVSLVFCSEPRVYIHSCTGSESLTTVAMVTAYFMHQSQRVSCDRKSNEGFFVFSTSKNLLCY